MGNRCNDCVSEGIVKRILGTEVHWGLWAGLGLGYSSDTIFIQDNGGYLEIKSLFILFVKIGIAVAYDCVREETDSAEGTDSKEDKKIKI